MLAADALTAIAPETWQDMVVVPHPTAQRLTLTTNAAAVWSAVREGEDAPEPETLAEPAAILVWRHEAVPMWRELSAPTRRWRGTRPPMACRLARFA